MSELISLEHRDGRVAEDPGDEPPEKENQLDFHDIVDALRRRRDRIQEAIDALENHPKSRRKYQRRRKRKLSDAAKRRISEAMKLRWEQRKKQA